MPPMSGCFFGKFTVQQILKSFFSRNDSLEPSVIRFYYSFPYVLEKPRELRALTSWDLAH